MAQAAATPKTKFAGTAMAAHDLPDDQLWQLVAYIRFIGADSAAHRAVALGAAANVTDVSPEELLEYALATVVASVGDAESPGARPSLTDIPDSRSRRTDVDIASDTRSPAE